MDGSSSPFGEGRRFTADTPHGQVQVVKHRLDRGTALYVIARHGVGHIHSPSEVNYRANIYALKQLDVSGVVGISAVGSRNRDLLPGTLVAVSQYIDHTDKGLRPGTFFGRGIVAHVGFGEPTCPNLRGDLVQAGRQVGIPIRDAETLMVMEGPPFSTQAEATLGQMQASLIGMTAMPEAKLAREAELCYVTLGCVTDFDACFGGPHVSAAEVGRVFNANREKAIVVVRKAAEIFLSRGNYLCVDQVALDTAIMTDLKYVQPERWKQLGPITARFLKSHGLDPRGRPIK